MISPAIRRSLFGSPCAAIFRPSSMWSTWWRVVEGEIADPVAEDAELSGGGPRSPAGRTLGRENRLGELDKGFAGERRAQGQRRCFIRLRLALTGRENGPELAALLPLIGRTKALARLSGPAA